jgi:hypothetical protein
LDDDCDGKVDEVFLDGVFYISDTACGNCSTNCTVVFNLPNAYGVCVESDEIGVQPGCEMQCCKTGDEHPNCVSTDSDTFDLNGVPEDGCEFEITDHAVYVSNTQFEANDDDSCGEGPLGTGFGNHPCRTITWGIKRAEVLGRSEVHVALGEYIETVHLSGGISLVGGFSPGIWVRNFNAKTSLRSSEDEQHKRTIVAIDLNSETRVEDFIIYGPVNLAEGGNSYAVYIRNSSTDLSFSRVMVMGGSAGSGTSAIDGNSGESGDHGGGRSLLGDVFDLNYDAFETTADGPCNPAHDRQYSNGGQRVCGLRDVRGGNGGGNQCSPAVGSEASALDGAPGWQGSADGDGNAGVGGDAGDDGLIFNEVIGNSIHNLCLVPDDSMTGLDGADGSPGSNGTAGLGATVGPGFVLDGHWRAAYATKGTGGAHGAGGGGGGGGGGSECASTCPECPNTCFKDRLGAHGGGGGSGGCGGDGGRAGKPGGGSFAFFVFEGATPTLTDVDIYLGIGGNGALGGKGGVGGLGGLGGFGGICDGSCFCFKEAGKGGNGGYGGSGGGGGGGAGGGSYGIYTWQVAQPVDHCLPNASVSMFGGSVGQGGQGGTGGSLLGPAGAKGADGMRMLCSYN